MDVEDFLVLSLSLSLLNIGKHTLSFFDVSHKEKRRKKRTHIEIGIFHFGSLGAGGAREQVELKQTFGGCRKPLKTL